MGLGVWEGGEEIKHCTTAMELSQMTSPVSTFELQELVRFASGGTPSKSDAANWGGDVPWLSAKDLKRFNLHDSQDHLTAQGAKGAMLAPPGSILILVRGMTLLKDLPLGVAMRPMTFNQDVKALFPSADIRPHYLAYILIARKQELLQLVETAGHGTGRLDTDILKSFPVDLPSLDQQDKFIEIVGAWDAAIDMTSALLDSLERRKQGLMQQLLTGRKRLKGFKGKWKQLRADKLFTEISIRNQTADEQLLSVTQDRGVIPRHMLVGRVTMPAGAVDAFKLVEPNDFVISLRSFQGGLEHSAYRGLVSPAYTVLQASDDIHPAYFRHYFKSTDFVKRLSVAVVGIRDGKQISYTDFRSIKLPLPPVREQIALNEVLDLADHDIALCCARLDSLQLQKRALMQKLLSGEWRLPEKPVPGKSLGKKGL